MKKRNRGVLGMLKMALNYNNRFIEDVRTMKEANIKEFSHTFLNLFIIGNKDLLDRLFHAH